MTKMTEREQIVLGSKQEQLAIQLASKEDAGVSAAIVEQMEAKEVTESGAIRVLLALRKTYGEQGILAFPRPGSTFETSDNPDKFKKEIVLSTGGTRTSERSFYIEFSDRTKEGEVILQELGYISLLKNKEADHRLIPEAFRNKYNTNPGVLKVREGYLNGRRATIRNAYKKAIALQYQCLDIYELKDVNIDFIWTDEARTSVVNTRTPIRIESISNKNLWNYYSIAQVMRMDVARAIENGGSYQALIDTMKRAPKPAISGESEAAPKSIRTADTFDARMTDINEALDYAFTDANGKPLLKAIKDTLHKAGSDQFILALHSTRQRLDVLLNDPKIQVRLQAILDSQDDE